MEQFENLKVKNGVSLYGIVSFFYLYITSFSVAVKILVGSANMWALSPKKSFWSVSYVVSYCIHSVFIDVGWVQY